MGIEDMAMKSINQELRECWQRIADNYGVMLERVDFTPDGLPDVEAQIFEPKQSTPDADKEREQ